MAAEKSLSIAAIALSYCQFHLHGVTYFFHCIEQNTFVRECSIVDVWGYCDSCTTSCSLRATTFQWNCKSYCISAVINLEKKRWAHEFTFRICYSTIQNQSQLRCGNYLNDSKTQGGRKFLLDGALSFKHLCLYDVFQ